MVPAIRAMMSGGKVKGRVVSDKGVLEIFSCLGVVPRVAVIESRRGRDRQGSGDVAASRPRSHNNHPDWCGSRARLVCGTAVGLGIGQGHLGGWTR